jgi:hypothetical protein
MLIFQFVSSTFFLITIIIKGTNCEAVYNSVYRSSYYFHANSLLQHFSINCLPHLRHYSLLFLTTFHLTCMFILVNYMNISDLLCATYIDTDFPLKNPVFQVQALTELGWNNETKCKWTPSVFTYADTVWRRVWILRVPEGKRQQVVKLCQPAAVAQSVRAAETTPTCVSH